MLHPTLAPPAICRSEDEWTIAVARNRQACITADLDGACQITHGRYFWPLEPEHPGNDYDIEFIAHVLAGDRRWAGVTTNRDGSPCDYSVAQHCVHVADIVNLNRDKLVPGGQWDLRPSPAFYGLMHDASEAYLRDAVRPIKPYLGDYYAIEARLMDRIITVFDVPVDGIIKEAVRRVDNMMIFMERDEMVGKPVVPYSNEFDHPHVSIHDLVPDFYVWSAREAKDRFLRKFEEIARNAGNYEPTEYRGRGYTL
jgi:hypothetical protein